MTDRTLTRIGRFFKDLAEAAATPSGDARGHVRDYALRPAPRDRM